MSVEQDRHRCEVRWCIRQGFAWFQVYARDVRNKRGAEAAERLWRDVKEQAAAGNTGAPNEWHTKELTT